ncbi:gp422 [Bacillus phage G]|uniref:Gp422 n=1 Tax=Bacillus phage G TaxID=2884420 RepID=G3MAG3_9CAUD|nr:gp422 [Bacillus phage G]AEO93680.1 gp422 [Bacillus phage G]
MSNEIKEELRKIAESNLPESVIVISYMEHMLDLVATITKELSNLIDKEKISPELQLKLDMLESLLQYSSVDFANIENPMQAYKIPKTIELKNQTRKVQERYLKKQIEKGVFGD